MSRGQLLVALDRITERLDNLTRNRETQAEVKELREELAHCDSFQQRDHAAALRAYAKARKLRAERDAKQDGWKRANDARDDLQGKLETEQVRSNNAERERDALQARIDRLLDLATFYDAHARAIDGRMVAKDIRGYIANDPHHAPPAEDDSEQAWRIEHEDEKRHQYDADDDRMCDDWDCECHKASR